MKSVTNLYYSFLKEHLSKQSKKIALLQLTGRIEDYLVKEFFWYAYTKGNFCLGNIGSKGQQKVDICLLKGSADAPIIYSMIEAKYLRNMHRIWQDTDATDENAESLKSLKQQLHRCSHVTHGNMDVEIIAKTKSIYGLVFASYVSMIRNDSDKRKFYSRILDVGKKDFRYHDLDKPYFRPVFDDVKVKVLGKVFYVTFKGGLWRRRAG